MNVTRKQFHKNRPDAGICLLEVLSVCAILAIVLVAVLAVLPKWTAAFEDNNIRAADNDRVRDIFSRMCDEIRQSGLSCPDWNLYQASSTVTFNKCIGSYGATKYWSAPIIYSYDAENGTLVRTTGGISRIICDNVKSMSFAPDENNVEINFVVTTESNKGRQLTSMLSSRVAIRN